MASGGVVDSTDAVVLDAEVAAATPGVEAAVCCTARQDARNFH